MVSQWNNRNKTEALPLIALFEISNLTNGNQWTMMVKMKKRRNNFTITENQINRRVLQEICSTTTSNIYRQVRIK